MRVNNSTYRSLFDNEIVCKLPDGTSKNMVIGENVYERTNPATTLTDISLVTRYLVQSPTAGRVTCTANISGHSLSPEDGTYRLVSGRIWFADTDVPNAVDGKPLQQSMPYGLSKVDATDPKTYAPVLDTFDLPAGFKTLSVFGETLYQVCHTTEPETACDERGVSTARFTLFINQWKRDGTLCHTSAETFRREDHAVLRTPRLRAAEQGQFRGQHRPGLHPALQRVCPRRVGGWSDTGGVQGTAVRLNDTNEGTTTHRSDTSHVFVVPLP